MVQYNEFIELAKEAKSILCVITQKSKKSDTKYLSFFIEDRKIYETKSGVVNSCPVLQSYKNNEDLHNKTNIYWL